MTPAGEGSRPTAAEKRARLREAVAAEGIMLPGVFNALAAVMAGRAGFQAVYLSGAAHAAQAGLPDIGLLTLDAFCELARPVVRAVDLPCISDADTGFGEPVQVARCVQELEAAGLAGCHIEDQVFPKRCGHLPGKEVIGAGAMCAKIRAGVEARTDPRFVLIARTDARAVEGLEAAAERARAYLDAGADWIFPEALESREEFEAFARAVEAPLVANMTEFGISPLLEFEELRAMGYRVVLYPLGALRLAMRAAESFYRTLLERGTQRDMVPTMLTREELYDLVGYDAYAALDRRVAGFRGGGGPTGGGRKKG